MNHTTHQPVTLLVAKVVLTSVALLGFNAAGLLGAAGGGSGVSTVPMPTQSDFLDGGAQLWRESWSRRFPGCVASVLWPSGEQPTAVLTRTPRGTVRHVGLGSGSSAMSADLAAGTTIGACRDLG